MSIVDRTWCTLTGKSNSFSYYRSQARQQIACIGNNPDKKHPETQLCPLEKPHVRIMPQ